MKHATMPSTDLYGVISYRFCEACVLSVAEMRSCVRSLVFRVQGFRVPGSGFLGFRF